MPANGIIFNTYWFVLFALIVVPVYWLLQKAPLRLPFLAIACAVFHYHFAGPAGVLPIIFIGTVTYFCGLSRNRAACAGGIVLSVAALCFYKYTHFLAIDVLGLINPAWGAAALEHAKHLVPGAVLAPSTAVNQTFIPPLGMSFFAFEFVHYLYDVRQGHEPIRNPMRFLLFAIFFPSLVAGPIKRYEQYQPSLQRGAEAVDTSDVALGLRRIAMGFFKKVVIADNLTLALTFYLPQTDSVTHFVGMTLLSRWMVLGMLGMRILMDFSGYSDIAIGLARLLGITLPENFNWPYAATSIQEFWQRWHISLSSWIRDYVYIPLGGNRHGLVRKIFNGFTAFALVGLWHGPAWNFVAWGVYHGVGLGVSGNYTAIPGLGPTLKKLADMHRPFCWVLTQLFVWLGWLLFFYPVGPAVKMAGLLFYVWKLAMTPAETIREWRASFVPSAVLVGILIGFGAMCGLGRHVAHLDYHPGFVRFIPQDAPDTKYYPTVNEMMAIVRHDIKPGQILVIVGGNSVLLGVGQPADHVWTKQLQADLGDRYFVINFAFRGASSNNCGAVVAEALRKEYPRQIFIANLPPTQMGYPTGSTVYRYENWEAYYKGLLVDDPVRNAEIKVSHAITEYYNAEFAVPELKIREWLDSWLYFQDLWNYFTFTKMNTVWGSYFPGVVGFQDPIRFLDPRDVYTDPEPDFLTMPMASRYIADDAAIQGELSNVRGVSIYAFKPDKGPDGKWQIYQPLWDEFQKEAAAAFPQELKKRTLILMGYNSPFYLSRLSPDELERNDLSFAQAVVEWKKAGYQALSYGKDYTLDDAGDRTHLTWHGGVKLAKVTAEKVREMSQQLGYLNP